MTSVTLSPIVEYGSGMQWVCKTTQDTTDDDVNRYYLGNANSRNYRSRFTLTIPSGIASSAIDRLVIRLKADSAATPKYMRAFLTDQNYTSSDYDEILGGTILETSYLWLDENKTNRAISYQSTPVDCYLVFNYKFKPGTTYYIHLLPYASDSAANTTLSFSTTWWRGRNKSEYLTATLYYESGAVRIYADGAWKTAIPYIYTDGAWKQAQPYIYTNGAWKLCN